MRSCTYRENALFDAMLKRNSVSLEFNVFDLSDRKYMNIEQIRAEIPKITDSRLKDRVQFIKEHDPTYSVSPSSDDGTVTDHVIRVLVDMAYEAGKADAIVIPDNATIAKISNESFDCGFEAGYNNAAKDPRAWYVLDKNGEQLHVGDTVHMGIVSMRVEALGDGWIRSSICDAGCNLIEKVIPDSWDKWKSEIQELIYQNIDDFDEYGEERGKGDRCAEAELRAEEFAERARKLAEVD